MNSPLGKYAAPVAAIAGIGLIGAYVIASLLQGTLGIASNAVENLKDMALIAMGAIFGAATAVNGTKASLNALHTRLDNANIPPSPNPPSTNG